MEEEGEEEEEDVVGAPQVKVGGKYCLARCLGLIQRHPFEGPQRGLLDPRCCQGAVLVVEVVVLVEVVVVVVVVVVLVVFVVVVLVTLRRIPLHKNLGTLPLPHLGTRLPRVHLHLHLYLHLQGRQRQQMSQSKVLHLFYNKKEVKFTIIRIPSLISVAE